MIGNTDYPKEPSPQDDSAGFVTPYKVATGATMGDLNIKGKITVTDDKKIVRLVLGYSKDAF